MLVYLRMKKGSFLKCGYTTSWFISWKIPKMDENWGYHHFRKCHILVIDAKLVNATRAYGMSTLHNVGPPSHKLIYKPPLTIVISTINHSYWSYVHQLSYPTGASHCSITLFCNQSTRAFSSLTDIRFNTRSVRSAGSNSK